MKIFTTSQVRLLDEFTIEHEPVSSLNLMERAANALYDRYLQIFDYSRPVCIFAGMGNNGGDALSLARAFLHSKMDVKVQIISSGKLSADCETNLKRLKEIFPDKITESVDNFVIPEIENNTVIIDGLFGSGLSRKLTGVYERLVEWINTSGCEVLSIDIPSGLQGEENEMSDCETDCTYPVIKAGYTFSLQFPKLAFFFAENEKYVGKWSVLDIGIHPKAVAETASNFYYLQKTDIQPLIKTRPKFSHKGTFGHVLLVAGSKGMAGASVLAARAALRCGVGLASVHGPKCNRVIVQTAVNEALYIADKNKNCITEVKNTENYIALVVGPGIGTAPETAKMIEQLLHVWDKPCVMDADALNIIAQHKSLLEKIPQQSILTPHPKEFERLFGVCSSSYNRMLKAAEVAMQYQFIIILKGAHTMIVLPNGKIVFNSTGNSGLATAGTGDVLSGILGSLLAQGYSPEVAAQLGVYLHGLSCELATEEQSEESMIAGDVVSFLGKAFKALK